MDTSNVREDGWEEQLIDYSLGVMDAGEAVTFEAGLAECRQHVRLAAQYEQSVAWMGLAVPSAEPPQGHKSRLMSRITATPQETSGAPVQPTMAAQPTTERPTLRVVPPVTDAATPPAGAPVVSLDEYRERRRNTLIAAAGAIAAALILVVGIWAFLGRTQGPPALEGYKVVQLAPQPDQPDYANVNAFVLFNPDKPDAIVLANGLPTLPAGKVYEFWAIPPGTGASPVRAGTFQAAATGDTRHEATTPQNASTYAAYAVSVEDAPGGDAPKGPIVAVASLP